MRAYWAAPLPRTALRVENAAAAIFHRMSEISILVTKELLRHSSATLSERYSRLIPDMKREAVAGIAKMMEKREDLVRSRRVFQENLYKCRYIPCNEVERIRESFNEDLHFFRK